MHICITSGVGVIVCTPMPLPLRQTELLALATPNSRNVKTGPIAVTYAAQASCPSSCPFINGGGCYAENGAMASGITLPLNHAAVWRDADALAVAEAEAAAIDELDVVPGRPMRLHSVGDCATDAAARIVADAAGRYIDRGGGPVWTYTHAWRDVARSSWGRVAVLASCEDAAAVELARGRGYAPSIVVDAFQDRRRHLHRVSRLRSVDVLPCPAQTSHATCASCRLCFDDQALLERGYAIAFEVHGTQLVRKKALAALHTPNDPRRRLTSRDFIDAYLRRHGRWPTTTEVTAGADVTWGSAAQMLDRMRTETAA